MERVLLTAENIKDADEFVDGDGQRWFRPERGFWSLGSHNNTDNDDDDDMAESLSCAWMRGAYVTRWKPGREPKAPATKWVKGYETRECRSEELGDGPAPVGTVLCNGVNIATVKSAGNHYFPAGWVVVREAPPEEEPWRRCIVDVRGNGADARIRFWPDYEGDDKPITASQFAAYATPAPDRAKVAEMLDDWRHDRGAMLCDILDYVCGPAPKDGGA